MSITTMRVSPPVITAFPRIANLEAACRVIGQLTAAGISVRLGVNEAVIRPDGELGPEHFPHFTRGRNGSVRRESQDRDVFRDSVLGFLAGTEKITNGVAQLIKIAPKNRPFFVPNLLDTFRFRELPEYITPWPFCSNTSNLIRHQEPSLLTRLAWFLRDWNLLGVAPAKFIADSSDILEQMKIGRVAMTPEISQNYLDGQLPIRITGLTTKSGYGINLWGIVYGDQLKDDGCGQPTEEIFAFNFESPLAEISLSGGIVSVKTTATPYENEKGKRLATKTYPVETVASITMTMAEDPIILPATQSSAD